MIYEVISKIYVLENFNIFRMLLLLETNVLFENN